MTDERGRDANKNKLVWQVEPVRDELQPAIDGYVMLRRTADAISRYVENELGEWGVTTAQYGVLLHLMREEALSLSSLSGLVFRSNSTLTALIDRMERAGLVARVNHASDRRIKQVMLTPKGRGLLLKIREHHRPFLSQMMSCLSPDELAQLCELLQKIEDKLERESRLREVA